MHHLIFSASALLGTDLISQDRISIGTLEDIILNKEEGSLSYFIISAGGYLGREDRLYALHHSYFYLNGDDEVLIFNPELGDPDQHHLPLLPEHYEGSFIMSYDEFKRNVLPFVKPAGHLSDND